MNAPDSWNPIFVLNTRKFFKFARKWGILCVFLLLVLCGFLAYLGLHFATGAFEEMLFFDEAMSFAFVLFPLGCSSLGPASALGRLNYEQDLVHYTGLSNWETVRGYIWTCWFFLGTIMGGAAIVLISFYLFTLAKMIAALVLVFALSLMIASYSVVMVALFAPVKTQVQNTISSMFLIVSIWGAFFFGIGFFLGSGLIERSLAGEPMRTSIIVIAGFFLWSCILLGILMRASFYLAKKNSEVKRGKSWGRIVITLVIYLLILIPGCLSLVPFLNAMDSP